MNFKLGQLQFTERFIQGPLAGYSHAAFRQLLWPADYLAYACTEMLPASCVINELHDKNNRYTWRHPNEKVLCYQLSGCIPNELALAAKIVSDLGADIIDLNAGCPKKKIRKKGCGSAMLADINNLQACLFAIKAAVSCPVTVKIRIPNPKSTLATSVLIQQLADTGVDAIIVHARDWQGDQQPILTEHFQAAVTASICPIIINGDIKTITEGEQMLAATKASACMIARAGFSKPWLYKQEHSPLITNYIISHLENMQLYLPENIICLQARSILYYYGKSLEQQLANELVGLAYSHDKLPELIKAVQKLNLC